MPPKRPAGGSIRFGRRVARARHAHKLTAEQLAARLGVAKNTVYSWERGETAPHPARLVALAEVLELDVDELETLINQKPPPNPLVTAQASEALPVVTTTEGGTFTLEISGIKVNVPVQTVPIHVWVTIGDIEAGVDDKPRQRT